MVLDCDIHIQCLLFTYSGQQKVLPSVTPLMKNKWMLEAGHRKWGEFNAHSQVIILVEKNHKK